MTCTNTNVTTSTSSTFSASVVHDSCTEIHSDDASLGQENKTNNTTDSVPSKSGILSCWRTKRHRCRCFRSKRNKIHRTSQMVSPSGSMSQLLHIGDIPPLPSEPGHQVFGDGPGSSQVENAFPSISPVSSALNETLKQIVRIFHRGAVTSPLPVPTEMHCSYPANLNVVNGDNNFRHQNNSEPRQKTKAHVAAANEHSSKVDLLCAAECEKTSSSEAATARDSVTTSFTMANLSENIGLSHVTTVTCNQRTEAKLPLVEDDFESSNVADHQSSVETEKLGQIACKQIARRSQSLVSSLSKSRRYQWIESAMYLERTLSLSTFYSSQSSDIAIAQETNENSITVSEEEMAELLKEALHESVSYPRQPDCMMSETPLTTKVEKNSQEIQTITDSSAIPQTTVGLSSESNSTQPANATDDIPSTKLTKTYDLSYPDAKYTKSSHTSCGAHQSIRSKTSMQIRQRNEILRSRSSFISRAKPKPTKCKTEMRMSCIVHKVYTYGDSRGSTPGPNRHASQDSKLTQNKNYLVCKNGSVSRNLKTTVTSRPCIRQNQTRLKQMLPTGDPKLVIQKNRNSSYTEKFNQRRLLAMKSTAALQTSKRLSRIARKKTDDRDDTCSLRTANILALAETSDLLGETSLRSFEKELQNLCFNSPNNKEDHERRAISRSSSKQEQRKLDITKPVTNDVALKPWILTPNSPLTTIPYPVYQIPVDPTNTYWLSSRYTAPNHVTIDPQPQIIPFVSPMMFAHTSTQHWPMLISSPGWMSTVGNTQLPATYGSLLTYQPAS